MRKIAIMALVLYAASASAVTCFHKGERVSGMNKMCFYDCLGSTVAINVKSYELCPLTINN